MCGLQWSDFDEINGTLKVMRSADKNIDGMQNVRETKTSAGTRKIVLPSSTYTVSE